MRCWSYVPPPTCCSLDLFGAPQRADSQQHVEKEQDHPSRLWICCLQISGTCRERDGLCIYEARDQINILETHPCYREDEKKADSSKAQTSDLRLQQGTSQQRHLQPDCLSCPATWRKSAGRRLRNRHKPATITDNFPTTAEASFLLCASVVGIQHHRAYTTVSLWHNALPIDPYVYPELC